MEVVEGRDRQRQRRNKRIEENKERIRIRLDKENGRGVKEVGEKEGEDDE